MPATYPPHQPNNEHWYFPSPLSSHTQTLYHNNPATPQKSQAQDPDTVHLKELLKFKRFTLNFGGLGRADYASINNQLTQKRDPCRALVQALEQIASADLKSHERYYIKTLNRSGLTLAGALECADRAGRNTPLGHLFLKTAAARDQLFEESNAQLRTPHIRGMSSFLKTSDTLWKESGFCFQTQPSTRNGHSIKTPAPRSQLEDIRLERYDRDVYRMGQQNDKAAKVLQQENIYLGAATVWYKGEARHHASLAPPMPQAYPHQSPGQQSIPVVIHGSFEHVLHSPPFAGQPYWPVAALPPAIRSYMPASSYLPHSASSQHLRAAVAAPLQPWTPSEQSVLSTPTRSQSATHRSQPVTPPISPSSLEGSAASPQSALSPGYTSSTQSIAGDSPHQGVSPRRQLSFDGEPHHQPLARVPSALQHGIGIWPHC